MNVNLFPNLILYLTPILKVRPTCEFKFRSIDMSCKRSLVRVSWEIAPRVMDCRMFNKPDLDMHVLSLVWVNWKIAPRVMDCRIFLFFWIAFIHTISNRVDIFILSRIIQRFIAIVLTHILQYNITVKITMTTAVLVGPFDHKVWLSTWFWPIFTAAHKVFLQKKTKTKLTNLANVDYIVL